MPRPLTEVADRPSQDGTRWSFRSVAYRHAHVFVDDQATYIGLRSDGLACAGERVFDSVRQRR